MKKRITALVVVLALLFSVLPTGIIAVEATGTGTTVAKDHAQEDHGDATVWTPWPEDNKLQSGNYYLENDVVLTKSALAISAGQTVKICLNGHSIIQQADGARVIGVMGDLTICDCAAHTDENGSYVSGSITGGTAAKLGAGIWVGTDSVFTMYDGRIENNKSAVLASGEKQNTASAVYLASGKGTKAGGVFNLYGGVICKNGTAKTNGGAVYVAGEATEADRSGKPATFNMYGGTIGGNADSGNVAATGGAVYATQDAVVNITNGTITGNTANVSGAVYIYGSQTMVTIKDSTITGNNSIYGFGAVNIASTHKDKIANLKLEGKTVIYGNTTGSAGDQNLHLQKGEYIVADLTGLTEGAKIGVSLQSTRITAGDMSFSSALGEADPSAYCLADDPSYEVVIKENRLTLAEHKHCLESDTGCTHEQLSWKAWSDPTKLPTESGSYFLTTDIALTAVGSVAADVNICLNGHTIRQTKEATRVVSIQQTGTLSVTDCKPAYDAEGNYVGGRITGGTGKQGSAIWVGGVFNMYGGRLDDNHGTDATSSAVFMMSSSTKRNGGVFNLYGGEVCNNGSETASGGAVGLQIDKTYDTHEYAPAQFNMYGGTISGNTAATGGGVYADMGTAVNLYGGTITGNTASVAGGGIYIAAGVSGFSVQGEPVVTGNTVGTNAGNLYLAGNTVMQLGELGEKALMGVAAETALRPISNALTEEQAAAYGVYFSSDNVYRVLQMQDNALYLGVTTDHQHCVCSSGASEGCDHSNQVWIPWVSTTSLPAESGNYYLTEDVDLTAVWSVTGDVNICLNGHTIRQTKDATRVISIQQTGKLSVTDCAQAYDAEGNYVGGRITNGTGTKGSAIWVGGVFNLYGGRMDENHGTDSTGSAVLMMSSNAKRNGGVFNMYGGEVCNNGSEAASGGAITLQGDSTYATHQNTPAQFNMYGGTISGNTAANGGGIYAEAGTAVNLYGGSISKNDAVKSGGGIYAKESVTITMTGGQISNNSAASGAGAMLMKGSTFTFKNGTISGNTAATSGAGVFAFSDVTFTMEGGTVSGNSASGNGGGLYLQQSKASLSGGTISGNTAVNNGGGIWFSGCEATLSGVVVKNNKATGKSGTGGGVGVGSAGTVKSVVTMTGGEIYHNSAYAGGGVVTLTGATFNLQKGSITGNAASASGAGVFASTDSVFNMSGGTISSNNAANNGAGVYMLQSKGTLSGGTITGNTAAAGGGGMWISASTVTLSGTAIKNNKTSKDGTGGGLGIGSTDTDKAVVTMTGGSITGNTSRAGGGVVVLTGSTFILKNGAITGNTAYASGAGVFVSSNCTFKMSGGSIADNSATDNGGGLFVLQSKGTFSGGTVSGNYAGKNGGGIWLSGSNITLSGTAIKNNKTSETGIAGGLGIGTAGTTGSVVTMTAGEISGNTARAGGGVLLQPNTTFNLEGGSVTDNKITASGGGIFVSNDATVNMTGGTVARNECTNHGAGVYIMRAVCNFSGGSVCNNIAKGSGGGFMITGDTAVVTINGTAVHENSATNGAAMVVQGAATLNVENSEIYKNTATSYGGGLYLSTKSFFNMQSGKFYENTAGLGGGAIFTAVSSNATMTGSSVTNNTSQAAGGGILARANFSITDSEICNNTASTNGGGIATDKTGVGGLGIQPGLVVENTKIDGNTAGGQGGGLYLSLGSTAALRSTTVTNNKAAAEGGGLWAIDDLTMHDLTVTSNTSGGKGHAVYLDASAYDGHSYFTGMMKMTGNMYICDNTGGDMYLGQQTTLVIDGEGLGESAKVAITLDSGLLTNRVYGAYNYEGGNCVYTISYGDRSITEPEVEAPAVEEPESTEPSASTEPAATEPDNSNVPIYAGIAAFAVLIIAAAVIIILAARKKKETTVE